MKANEFVRRFGLNTFRLSAGSVSTRKYLVVYEDEIDFADEIKPSHGKCVFDRLEVKRLVESHNLVEKVGGMDKAKMLLRMRIAAELYESADEIEKAIADVESCMEVKSDS